MRDGEKPFESVLVKLRKIKAREYSRRAAQKPTEQGKPGVEYSGSAQTLQDRVTDKYKV